MSGVSGLRRLWAETSPPVRAASVAMWAGAGLGTALGVVGDERGWWAAHAFLTNLLSSLVGALAGIPLALIVIRRITAVESRRLERAEALHMARFTVRSLAADLAPLCPDRQRAADLADVLHHIDRDRLPALPDLRFGPALAEVLELWSRQAGSLPLAVRTGPPAADILDDAEDTWRHLCRDIAPRLQLYGVPWLPRATVDRIERLFAAAVDFSRDDQCEVRELTEAARAALAAGDVGPLVALYEDEYAIVGGIREQAVTLSAGIDAVLALCAEVDRLGAGLPPA